MSMLGTRVARKEDPDLLTVGGKYVDDIAPADAVHAAFVRSIVAHAELGGIDTSEAEAAPGVLAVYTAADLPLLPIKPRIPLLNQDMQRMALATDRVRYVGEPIAVVLAETREAAVDAAELVIVDYQYLDAVVDMHEARTDENLLFPHAGTNTCFTIPAGSDEDIFADCEVTVELGFRNQRLTAAPIEPRATLARWDDDGSGLRLTQWSCTQFPHTTRDNIAAAIGVEPDRVRVITPDVGGGFGAKGGNYPEDHVVALASRELGRPVRWVESRSENMIGMVHGRAVDFEAKLGGTRDGRITAYRLHAIQDAGGYPEIGAVLPMFMSIMASGVYDIPNVIVSAESIVTNTVPVGAYRGAGRPEATHALERTVDVFAAELGMDPVDVRRRNFIAKEAFPYTTPTGAAMDTGDYEAALDKVLEAIDYAGLRAEQQRRRATTDEPLLGIGWAAYVEITNPVASPEFGSVEIRTDGSALVLTGTSPHGQGHDTAYAMIASDLTGIPFDDIEVRHGDTDEVKRGGGTGGSRSLQMGGTAIKYAIDDVIEQAKEIAAGILEANPGDMTLDVTDGSFAVAGTPARSVGWADIAAKASEGERGSERLMAEADFEVDGATFPFGVHLSIVEVDRETGRVTPTRHVSCDDAGVIINPLLVDGQVHGGVASGIAHALVEEFIYDEDGNPQTGNFMDYALVSAAELPSFERIEQETPTPKNPLGAKGIGEAGTIGSTPAVQNAVIDALSHLGIGHIDIPTTSERVWRAIQDA